MGQKIGVLGKEGASGGWSHLHFDIKARQPSGKWGIQEGYAFLWEAYLREHKPQLIAVARPHHLIWAGEKVVLDGSRSWSAAGKIERYEWTFTDGTTATGPRVERTYDQPGEYSEVLKVVDARGRVDYDFAVVLVIDKAARRQVLADDPRELRADLRHPPGRPGHIQGEDVLRRAHGRDVGLRRRQPARDGPVGREREAAGPGRLRRDGPPLPEAGALPGPGRADGPRRGQVGGSAPGASR